MLGLWPVRSSRRASRNREEAARALCQKTSHTRKEEGHGLRRPRPHNRQRDLVHGSSGEACELPAGIVRIRVVSQVKFGPQGPLVVRGGLGSQVVRDQLIGAKVREPQAERSLAAQMHRRVVTPLSLAGGSVWARIL